jgi:hypothetical protein
MLDAGLKVFNLWMASIGSRERSGKGGERGGGQWSGIKEREGEVADGRIAEEGSKDEINEFSPFYGSTQV